MIKLKQKFHAHVLDLQERITQKLFELDPGINLIEDNWGRTDFEGNEGGGGRTRAFQGEIIENAGVNTSCIYGAIDPKFAGQLKGQGHHLWACGISLIIHPRNPKAPTVHANFRLIEQGGVTWIGGGADLTPYYPITEDFTYFHKVWADACQPFDSYEWMKKECDKYFVNHHRLHNDIPEMRGVSGIFYDHFNTGDMTKDLEMAQILSEAFIPSYFPIVEKRKNELYNEQDVDFQLHRRGRYVEFNLIHDRGTIFGLKTNGRIDSILISLPARCNYSYQYRPKVGSPHEEMMNYYRPVDWLNFSHVR